MEGVGVSLPAHTTCVGQQGTGKTNLLPVCVCNTSGDLAEHSVCAD